MSVNVAFFPGWLGSSLGFVAGVFGYRYPLWPNIPGALAGQLAQLQLASDGLSPGPFARGAPSSYIDVLGEIYAPLLSWLRQQGFNVLPVPIDWRLSLADSGPACLTQITAAFGTEPFAMLAHSHGGLVARSCYNVMSGSGRDSQVTRLVTLGTPHFGCMEAVKCLFRFSQYYSILQAVCGWQHWFIPDLGPDFLDNVVATFPSLYELLPSRDYGWLFQTQPGQVAEIYTPSFWATANPWFSAARLASAPAAQNSISNAIPAGRTVVVAGVGYETAIGLDLLNSQTTEAGYVSSGDGDGIVGVGFTQLPNTPLYIVNGRHSLLPSNGQVLSMLYGLLTTGVPAFPPVSVAA